MPLSAATASSSLNGARVSWSRSPLERGFRDADDVLGLASAELERAQGVDSRGQQRLRPGEGMHDVPVHSHFRAVLGHDPVPYDARHDAGHLLPHDGVDERLPYGLGPGVAQPAQRADRIGEDRVVRQHLVEAVHADVESQQPRDALRGGSERRRRASVRQRDLDAAGNRTGRDAEGLSVHPEGAVVHAVHEQV